MFQNVRLSKGLKAERKLKDELPEEVSTDKCFI